METNNDKIMAEYAIARFCLGYDYLAKNIAATLFEKVVKRKFFVINPAKLRSLIRSKKENYLDNIISELYKELGDQVDKVGYVFSSPLFFGIKNNKGAIDKLFAYKELRNLIVHPNDNLNGKKLTDGEFIEFLLYILAECSAETFCNVFEDKVTFDLVSIRSALEEVPADYMVRSLDEIMIRRFDAEIYKSTSKNNLSCPFVIGDLDNLFNMRRKLVNFKNDLQIWLDDDDSRGIKTTILTTIDTSSGYLWMPLIHRSVCAPDIRRPNLDHATASIMVTPLDFRIYIDFGGHCKAGRLKYYEFISEENGPFRKFLDNLSAEDSRLFKIFDVEWYSAITRNLTAEDVHQDTDEFKRFAAIATKQVTDSGDSIITSNKMLSGFVFDRRWFEANNELSSEDIFDKLRKVIDLYYDLLLSDVY